jgi:hypothetical protein
MMKRELIIIFCVTVALLAFMVIKGFTPEVDQKAMLPSMSPSLVPLQLASPTPVVSTTIVYRSFIPPDAITENRLAIGATCKPYAGRLTEGKYSYAREDDKSFLGRVTAFRVGSAKVEVNDYLTERVIEKDLLQNSVSTSTTKYYDQNCEEILPGRIKVGDYVIVYAPIRSGNYYQVQYFQLLNASL